MLASLNGYKDVVRLLFKNGADIDQVTDNNMTSLMIACNEGKKEMVRLLVSLGADIDCTDDKQDTAEKIARKKNHRSIVDYLRSLSRKGPKLFSVPKYERINNLSVAVMMPFDKKFDNIYKTIKKTVEDNGLECCRVDEVPSTGIIVQKIVDLIDTSIVTICDCTNKNANVFYEMGIAHTLGREVIIIAQDSEEIPFDIRHIKHTIYNKNNLDELKKELGKIIRASMRRSNSRG